MLEKVCTVSVQVEGMVGTPPPGGDDSDDGLGDLGFAEPEPANLEEVYMGELASLQIGTFDSTLPRAYNR